VKDTFLGYVELKTGVIKSVMLMDRRFEVSQSSVPNYMKITNMSRYLSALTSQPKCYNLYFNLADPLLLTA
jgi:hypothetical protein